MPSGKLPSNGMILLCFTHHLITFPAPSSLMCQAPRWGMKGQRWPAPVLGGMVFIPSPPSSAKLGQKAPGALRSPKASCILLRLPTFLIPWMPHQRLWVDKNPAPEGVVLTLRN